VAVPAGDVVRIEPHHLARAHHEVFEDLVERVAHMQMAVGVGRAVMEDIFGPPLCRRAKLAIEVHRLPPRQPFRLGFGEAGAHRERGPGQEERVFVIAR